MKKWFPHIFVLFSFVFMVMLGTWQVFRLEWKNELMRKIDERIDQQPITPDEFTDIERDEFRPMAVTGKFLHEREFILLNKPFNGKAGYHVATPLLTADGDTIIVNRGWVQSDKEPERNDELHTITGIVRATQQLNFIGRQVMIPNTPEKNQWFWIDLPEMYKSVGAAEKPFYLIMTREDEKPESYPYALPKDIKLYNEHMQYAITWYSLAIVILVIYYFRFIRRR